LLIFHQSAHEASSFGILFLMIFSAFFHFPGSLGLSQAQDDFILLKGKGCRDQIFRTSAGLMNAAFVVVIQFLDGLESSSLAFSRMNGDGRARKPGVVRNQIPAELASLLSLGRPWWGMVE
jgi:hypothetical protein